MKMIVFYNPFSKGVMVGEKKNETMMYISHQEKKICYGQDSNIEK